ncbi:class I SAM-dependent methyltransferase [Actinoplanes sp. NEAU-A12]|uniref:Class I SAM-dependent methyltransferase n=1 Tax=Actinoplanes sandaracinus TaxID=3045177 RepID=A0ABT6WVL2_9ACTN|nr:class I SAM-dependent methyltransferase [Actinoplanes sandaracinus]MDI6103787.1 class I SAM-dependent methyltransferase [Actinoplanes sandaracinus]
MPKLRHTPAGDYLPGAGRHWLLPLYDPLSRLAGVGRLHRLLLDSAGIRAGQRVLEIGCGTGNLITALARRTPGVDAVGIDPDPAALRRARRKAAKTGGGIRFEEAFAGRLPLPDDHVDHVLSSLMMHHLDETGRDQALREALRVLRPGGRLHVLDVEGHLGRSHGLSPRTFTTAGFTAADRTAGGRLRRVGGYAVHRAEK